MSQIITVKEAYQAVTRAFPIELGMINRNNQSLAAFAIEMDQVIDEIVREKLSATHYPEKAITCVSALKHKCSALTTYSSKNLDSLQRKMRIARELASKVSSFTKGPAGYDTVRMTNYINSDLAKQLKAEYKETESYDLNLYLLDRSLRASAFQQAHLIHVIDGKARTLNNIFSNRGCFSLLCSNFYAYITGAHSEIEIPFQTKSVPVTPTTSEPKAPSQEAPVATSAPTSVTKSNNLFTRLWENWTSRPAPSQAAPTTANAHSPATRSLSSPPTPKEPEQLPAPQAQPVILPNLAEVYPKTTIDLVVTPSLVSSDPAPQQPSATQEASITPKVTSPRTRITFDAIPPLKPVEEEKRKEARPATPAASTVEATSAGPRRSARILGQKNKTASS